MGRFKSFLFSALSDVAFTWWAVKNPLAAYRMRVDNRKRAAAAKARFEAFKRSRGL